MAENWNKKRKSLIAVFCIVVTVFCMNVSAQNSEPSFFQLANYRTAKRCLEIARDSLLSFNYEEAYSLVLTGLEYDTSIPDLWYLKALLLSRQNGSLYEIRNAAQSALSVSPWLYYTYDAARILTAQVLVKTGEVEKSLEILNAKPLILTGDAEYIRAEAFYKLSQERKAREVIANARKSFPNDSRFPLLFFTYERFTYDEKDPYYNELLQNLLKMTDNWKIYNTDILLFASYFLENPQKERYLKEYRLSEKKNPLYIAAFLEVGLLSEQEAVNELFAVAEKQIDGSVFFEILSLIKSTDSLLSIAENLETFSGTLLFDENRDKEYDFNVVYKYGRPYSITYDENSDGLPNWYSELDYGNPVKLNFYEQNVELYYSRYPYISNVLLLDDKETMEIQLIDGSVDWKPFSMEQIPIINNLVFYLPSLENNTEFISRNLFLQNASEILVIDGENDDRAIRFSMRDSLPKTSVYTRNGNPYAYGFFEDGLLIFRNVDNDKNGSYELSEMYSFSPDASKVYLNASQSQAMYKELFGSLEANEGLFVTKVIADTNENSITDFMEEYLEDGAVITSWDSNEDGLWDIFYEKKASVRDGLKQKVTYIHPIDNSPVVILFENHEPVEVLNGNQIIPITKMADIPFYWLGDVPDSSFGFAAFNALQKENVQGLRLLITPDADSNERIFAIKVDNFYFGEFINE